MKLRDKENRRASHAGKQRPGFAPIVRSGAQGNVILGLNAALNLAESSDHRTIQVPDAAVVRGDWRA
jgi:hypothetical protein